MVDDAGALHVSGSFWSGMDGLERSAPRTRPARAGPGSGGGFGPGAQAGRIAPASPIATPREFRAQRISRRCRSRLRDRVVRRSAGRFISIAVAVIASDEDDGADARECLAVHHALAQLLPWNICALPGW
jgi:hypothetical protein